MVYQQLLAKTMSQIISPRGAKVIQKNSFLVGSEESVLSINVILQSPSNP